MYYGDDVNLKKWSLKYDKCIKCGNSTLKHISRGLCEKCYRKDSEDRSKNPTRQRNIAGSKLTKEFLIDTYTIKMKSLGDIAKMSSCSRAYVFKKIKLYDIPLRDKKNARELALKQGKISHTKIDDNGQLHSTVYQFVRLNKYFFSNWNQKMAYVLGLIYTDGHIYPAKNKDSTRKTTSNSSRIGFGQKEPELLLKFLNIIDSNARIGHKKEKMYGNIKSGELYYIQLNSDKMYNDLINIGLTPKKSVTISFPKVPSEYLRHFIRGCWDGDGSVYTEYGRKGIYASYISGSKQFIEGLVIVLNNNGIENIKIFTGQHKHQKNPHYYIRISKTQDILKLYHYLYDGVTSNEYLERKYKKFKQFADSMESSILNNS